MTEVVGQKEFSELDDSYHHAIKALSSDIGMVLSSELGVGKFYSDRLREIARELIMEDDEQYEMDNPPVVYYRPKLLGKVAEELGANVARTVENWIVIAFPDTATDFLRYKWNDRLDKLIHAWDLVNVGSGLPFDKAEETAIRTAIRDFRHHARVLNLEMERVWKAGISAWDMRYGANDNAFMLFTWSGFYNYSTYVFWKDLLNKISPKQLDELVNWVRNKEHLDPSTSLLLPK